MDITGSSLPSRCYFIHSIVDTEIKEFEHGYNRSAKKQPHIAPNIPWKYTNIR